MTEMPRLPCVLVVALAMFTGGVCNDDSGDDERPVDAHSWRYIFPFFPAEVDVLLGHLRTTLVRLEETLDTCEDMLKGEYEGENNQVGVLELSNPARNDTDRSMAEKVELIHELREKVRDLEDKIEKCRFDFWSGRDT